MWQGNLIWHNQSLSFSMPSLFCMLDFYQMNLIAASSLWMHCFQVSDGAP